MYFKPKEDHYLSDGNYVYRFLNKNEDVIYAGSSNNLFSRFKSHNHLPETCYKETAKIEYQNLESNSDMFLYEIYYINKLKPKYNTAAMGYGELSVELPEGKWFECDMNISWMKGERIVEIKSDNKSINENVLNKRSKMSEILHLYNNQIISYSVEKELLRRLCLTSRMDLIRAFQREGYFIKWIDRYNARGKKIFKPILININN